MFVVVNPPPKLFLDLMISSDDDILPPKKRAIESSNNNQANPFSLLTLMIPVLVRCPIFLIQKAHLILVILSKQDLIPGYVHINRSGGVCGGKKGRGRVL